jgi:hypothetical protein
LPAGEDLFIYLYRSTIQVAESRVKQTYDSTGCLLIKVKNYVLISQARKYPVTYNWWQTCTSVCKNIDIFIFLEPVWNNHIFIFLIHLPAKMGKIEK